MNQTQHKLRTVPSTPNSYFITFEGTEGAGKSSQMDTTREFFEVRGYEVTLVREPGSTQFGESLRAAILTSNTKLHPMAEAHLFASARSQLLHEKVLPKMAQEKQVILCDRYLDSSLAYQGMARGLGIETILDIHSHEPLFYSPHLTFYLQVILETSIERQLKRGDEKDYFEKEKRDFFQQLIKGYDETATLFPDRIKVINAEHNQEKVSESILKHLHDWIKQ
jgi:dTMP kinase